MLFGLVLAWNVSAVSHPSPQPPSNTALGKQTIFTAPPQLLKEPGLSEGIAGSSPGLAGGGRGAGLFLPWISQSALLEVQIISSCVRD